MGEPGDKPGVTMILSRGTVLIVAATLAGWVASSPAQNACFEGGCHQKLASLPVKHSAMEAGCDNCHSPEDEQRHTFSLVEEEDALCRLCHEELIGADVRHGAVEAGGCIVCHDPHGSAYAKSLADSLPELCFGCHEDLAESMGDTLIHGAVTTGKKCVSCHNPHSSPRAKLLAREVPALCFDCHNRTLQGPDGPIRELAKWIEQAEVIHGPVAADECLPCHDPHGNKRRRMLTEAFPSGPYTSWSPEAYRLCFSCHDSTLVSAAVTDETTGFRNGTKNLHNVHVARSKGRSCRICHYPHAGPDRALLRRSSPFGRWRLSLRWKGSENGGSCAPSCHRKRSYKRTGEAGGKAR